VIAARHGVIVIEDAAQAIGAELAGRRAGSIGDYGCLSFFPSKNLGCAGDGGMVLCRDEARADKLRVIRNHGAKVRYFHTLVGGNFRLDALQAAILRVKLQHLDQWTAGRQRNAARYRELLRDADVLLPFSRPNARHVYNQFVIRTAKREALREVLNARGIGNEVYYPQPFHLQACFAGWQLPKGSFPQSELASEQALALPIFPELTSSQLEEVASAVIDGLR
jgi:dTDP-4-amino-4,6-dideoxygalactose transaminase